MKLTRSQIYLLVTAFLALTIGLVTNIASNQMPERLKPFLSYAWPLLGFLVLVFLIMTILSSRSSALTFSPDFSLKRYYLALKRRYQTLDLDALTPPQKEEYLQLQLTSVFVEPSVRANPPPIELPKEILEKLQIAGEIGHDELPAELKADEIRDASQRYYESPRIPVLKALAPAKSNHSVVLGDPGSGKSTLSRYLLLSLIESDGDERIQASMKGFLPVLIELRTFNALREEHKCDTFLEFVEFLGRTEGWHLTQATLHDHLSKGKALVVFDGLDEIFDGGDRERIARAIVGFAESYPSVKVIVTSRIVGYQRKVLSDAGFNHYTLQDLDRTQVKAFIKKWYSLALSDRPDDSRSRQTRILNSFDHSPSIRQLAGNPMLLTIMAIIGKHQELPRERWKLYEHAASVLIEHWDVKRHLENLNVDAPFIGEDDKKELLRNLALTMQAGKGGLKGNYVHRDHLHSKFEEYLKNRFRISVERATTIAKFMVEQFRQRNFILSLYGANVYGFVHRAFLEYFCAAAFVHKFEKSRKISPTRLKEEVFGDHWRDESWHEVLRLICGMIDEKYAGDVIAYLAREARVVMRGPQFEESELLCVPLSVQCLSEVRNLNLITDAAEVVLETAVLFFAFVMTKDPGRSALVQVVTAAEAIGSNWPSREGLADFLAKPGIFDNANESWFYASTFGKFIASIGNGVPAIHERILEFADHSNSNYRVLVPHTLAEGWPADPRTLQIVQRLSSDEDENARWVSIQVLYYHFTNHPMTMQILKDRAVNDNSDSVRNIAISHLGFWSDDNQIFQILRDRVQGEPVQYVRIQALNTIISRFANRKETHALLEDMAEHDASIELRDRAKSALSSPQ